jgi:ABC-type Zn uptake system ZnuABC Zn-binding protein ZnuA|tara:strand:+ start:391 stop:663 length:273 start_codon:yes stop_codon:yes gene_type:complete
MEIIVISVLSISTLVLGFTTWNLLRKTEKQEDIIMQYDEYIKEFNKQIELADERLKKIDEKDLFKSDDEIGWFFKQIKVIQNGISRFKIN